MRKRRLFLDYDLTIVDSITAFAKTYNELYKHHEDFVPADPNKITSYDFRCICPLLDNEAKTTIWEHQTFFNFVDFMDDNTLSVLEKLSKKYELVICSIGVPKNISLKALWIEKHLPFIENYVLINNGNGCTMNKSIVNMKGGIIVDDIPSNLESSNADEKILFGKEYSWNRGWYGERCSSWKELGERLL